MSLLRWLLHECECCGAKIPRGTGSYGLAWFRWLCDVCLRAPCLHHIFPKPTYWIHRGERA